MSCGSSILPQKFFPHLSAASLMDRMLPCFLSSLPSSTIFMIQYTVIFLHLHGLYSNKIQLELHDVRKMCISNEDARRRFEV